MLSIIAMQPGVVLRAIFSPPLSTIITNPESALPTTMSHEASSYITAIVKESIIAQALEPAEQVTDEQVHRTHDTTDNPRLSQTAPPVKRAISTSSEEPKGPDPPESFQEVKALAVEKRPLPPPAFIIQEVPHNIGDEDQLWKNANKLAKDLIEEQTKSMDSTLDTMLIFVSSKLLAHA
jgi:hypothetical protein